jgi:hypothetical protein
VGAQKAGDEPVAIKWFPLNEVDLAFLRPCSACEKEARLVDRPAPTKHSQNKNGLLPPTIYKYAAGVKGRASQRGDDPDQLLFHNYLHEASYGHEDAALTALGEVLIYYPERLWHPYVRWQLSHLTFLGRYPKLPRKVRDRANSALVGLVEAWVSGLGYRATLSRSTLRRGQAPSLFPLIDEQEGLRETPEAFRHTLAADDFLSLWDDLMERLKKLRWKATRNEYRAVARAGKEVVVAELVEKLKPILQGFWASYRRVGSDFCSLTGDFPSDVILHEISRKALAVPSGRNPRDTIGYEFLGRLKFNIGGRETLEEWAPMSASPSLIKSTLRTLRKRPRAIVIGPKPPRQN